MYKKDILIKKIENTRKELKKIIYEIGNLTDPKVINKSKELDNLLNQYNGISSPKEKYVNV